MTHAQLQTSEALSAVEFDAELLLREDFSRPCREGHVLGRTCETGQKRLGLDLEGVFSIDNDALRIAPLIEAGFGRAVLSYGPFARRPGLAFAVFMTNGHNTSQSEPLSDSFKHRIHLWMRGSQLEPRWRRIVWWLWNARFRRAWRQVRWWKRSEKGERPIVLLNENLALGWFAKSVVADPRVDGHPFVMHALGPENGELWTGTAKSRSRSLRGVQNLPIYYVAVARRFGTVYYVCSLEGAIGLPPYPWLTPVAVDHAPLPEELYLGLQQGVLGQIGFRLDSRVYGARVAILPGYDAWFGGAHAADLSPSIHTGSNLRAEMGGSWQILTDFGSELSTQHSSASVAVLQPAAPTGLIHAFASAPVDTSERTGLVWRFVDERNHWRLELTASSCQMILVANGRREVVMSRQYRAQDPATVRLQVRDEGRRMMAFVDGEPLQDAWVSHSRHSDASRVGLLFDTSRQVPTTVSRFEAHPRAVKLPDVLDMGAPWMRTGTRVVIEDNFDGPPGHLAGRVTSTGQTWRRILGSGFIDVTSGNAAQVRATVREPCPGRTAYCIDWSHQDFVDAEVTITPPGNGPGEKQRTTAGFIIYQDDHNYLTLNAYRSDYYPAGSVSTFFKFGGFEDVYDAIWSNVADRINYGQPLRLRLCSDGERYIVLINDEVVLFRAFRDVYPDIERLRIRKIGIIANWEFGNDTGSRFERFRLRV
jgi:hypothetical protein